MKKKERKSSIDIKYKKWLKKRLVTGQRIIIVMLINCTNKKLLNFI